MAGRSLSLAAYRALSRRAPATAAPDWPDRPKGELVWIHLGRAADLPAALSIADRLRMLNADLNVLITRAPEETWPDRRPRAGIFLSEVPSEHPAATRAFAEHWAPDVGLWIWGGLRPNLIEEVAARGARLHIVAAETEGFDGRRDRWLPELSRHVLQRFTTASAVSEAASQRLSRLGFPVSSTTRTVAPQSAGRLLHCAPEEFDSLAQSLAGRPVWLAANIDAGEVSVVLDAHRQALRSSHRLLLILNPGNADDGLADVLALLASGGFAYALWSDGQSPEETTQVLVADLPDALGLWYRTASVTFLGSSLKGTAPCRDPLEAAALGTAILYGPNVRPHLESYSRLVGAGAARIVKDADSLATAVVQLIAPDQAAAMAHAGWDVVSEGAQVIDTITDLVQATLDGEFDTTPMAAGRGGNDEGT